MRYLITGGAGFIGSNLVQSLLELGEDVRVLDNFSTGRRENLEAVEQWAASAGGRFELIEGDIRNADACADATRDVDFVLHEAAIPSVQRSVDDPAATNSVNVAGTLNMLEAARRAGVKRFVFASSSSLYGESERLPKVETMTPDPVSPYGLQKLTGEIYCRLYHRLYGLPTVALRYFNVFGPRQNPNSDYAAVVPSFLVAARNHRRPKIYGDGNQTRDFTYVANVIHANLRACQAGPVALGRAYNIACGQRISLNELLGEISKLVGDEIRALHEEPRPGDIMHSMAGIARATEDLQYRPEVTLEQGLRQTLETV